MNPASGSRAPPFRSGEGVPGEVGAAPDHVPSWPAMIWFDVGWGARTGVVRRGWEAAEIG
jgi:hypothetical protein